MEETTYELDDLLDCPFCGERPTMHYLSNTFSNLEMYWVICPCCSATIKNVAITEELAKQVWNRRFERCVGSQALKREYMRGYDKAWDEIGRG